MSEPPLSTDDEELNVTANDTNIYSFNQPAHRSATRETTYPKAKDGATAYDESFNLSPLRGGREDYLSTIHEAHKAGNEDAADVLLVSFVEKNRPTHIASITPKSPSRTGMCACGCVWMKHFPTAISV